MKILKWIGTAIAFLFAIKLATDARRAQQRSDAATDREVAELAKGKQANLKKADKLGKTANVLFTKAKVAKQRSEDRAKQLEKNDATTLANRVRDFNKRL